MRSSPPQGAAGAGGGWTHPPEVREKGLGHGDKGRISWGGALQEEKAWKAVPERAAGRSQGWCSVWKSVWEAALWESLLASDLFGWGRTVEQKVNSGTSSTGTQREADAISFRAALREGGEVEMGQRLQGVREGLLGGGGGQAPWSCPSVYRLFPHPRLYQADSFSFLHWLPQWRGLKSDSWTSWVTIIRDVPSFAMS